MDLIIDREEQYKEMILKYCNRIISEKRLIIEDDSCKNMYSIKFIQPEWFLELDDDLQYNIMISLQSHYRDVISEYFKLYENPINRKRKFRESEN